MKKFILPILMVGILLPNMVFAAWWNPFTWKIFNRPPKIEPVVELPKEETNDSVVNQSAEIEKLKREVDELKRKRINSPAQQETRVQTAPSKQEALSQPVVKDRKSTRLNSSHSHISYA